MDKNLILIALSESPQVEFSDQSLPRRVFSAIWALESEVNNGGFSLYYFNYSSETASFVVEALETVGAMKAADICRRANEVAFPDGLPKTPEEFRSAASGFSEEVESALDALDREFYGYPDPLTDLLFAYVVKHPEEFGTIAEPENG